MVCFCSSLSIVLDREDVTEIYQKHLFFEQWSNICALKCVGKLFSLVKLLLTFVKCPKIASQPSFKAHCGILEGSIVC